MIRSLLCSVTMALTFAAGPAPAATIDHGAAVVLETPPPPGPARELALPAVETYQMPNGLTVTLVPFGSVPKVTLSLRVRAGWLDEDKPGVADLMTDLMNEGAAGLSPADLARRAGGMGGGIGVSGGRESVSAGIDVLSEHAADAVALLADVIRRPDLPASELPRLRQDMLRGLAIARTSPSSMAGDAFAKAFLPGHPFGRGNLEPAQVEAVTIDDIRRFHAEKLGAARAHLYVAGQFDAAAVRRAIEAAFGDWQGGPPPRLRPPVPNDKLKLVLVDRPGAVQSTLIVAAPLPAADYPDRVTMTVADELLGGAFTSRITLNLREDKGYTYSPGSSVSYGLRYGAWTLSADVTAAHTGDSLTEIFKEIDRLAHEAPPAAELNGKQNSIAGSWVLRTATRSGIVGGLSFYDIQGLPRDELGAYLGKVRGVTPADVSRVIGAYLRPERMTVVVVGDLKSVTPQLARVSRLKNALPGRQVERKRGEPQ